MPPVPAERPEELLAHADFVRDLAHHLLWDPDAADDLAQQAWVAAVERPPRDPGRARGWFAAVIANLARKRWRGEARRRIRERAAARPEPTVSTDELVAAEEARRRVVDAVLALDEPYRTAVVLRFYDARPPRAIAKRLGVPVATVKTRLKRGLATLREQLDATHGGTRAAWALALLPLAGLPAEAGVAAGAILMGGIMATKANLGVVAAAFALGAVVGTVGVAPLLGGRAADRAEGRGSRGPLDGAHDTATTVAPAPDPPANGGLAPGVEAAPPPPEAEPSPAYDAALGIVLTGVVRDPAGVPVPGAHVWARGPENARAGTHGPSFAMAGLKPGAWTLSARAPGFKDAEVALELAADRPLHRQDLTLARAMLVTVRFRAPDGGAVLPAVQQTLAAAERFLFESPLIAAVTLEPVAGALPLTPYRSHARFGAGTWRERGFEAQAQKIAIPEGADGLLEVSAPPPFFVHAVVRHVVVATTRVEPGVDAVTLVVSPEAVLGAFGTVRVHVVDAETGTPVAASVELSDRQSTGTGSPVGADGRFEQPFVEPGLLELQVFAEGYEALHHYVHVAPGAVTDLGTLRLRKGRTVKGRVVGPDGAPRACRITLHVLDRLPFPQDLDIGGVFASDESGAFEGWGVPAGRVVLRLEPEDEALAVMLVPLDVSGGDVEGLPVTLTAGVPVTLPSTVPATTARVVWLVDERGLPVYTDYVYGPWERATRLAPGRYRLLVHDPDGRLRSETPVTVGDGPTTIPIGPG